MVVGGTFIGEWMASFNTFFARPSASLRSPLRFPPAPEDDWAVCDMAQTKQNKNMFVNVNVDVGVNVNLDVRTKHNTKHNP